MRLRSAVCMSLRSSFDHLLVLFGGSLDGAFLVFPGSAALSPCFYVLFLALALRPTTPPRLHPPLLPSSFALSPPLFCPSAAPPPFFCPSAAPPPLFCCLHASILASCRPVFILVFCNYALFLGVFLPLLRLFTLFFDNFSLSGVKNGGRLSENAKN